MTDKDKQKRLVELIREKDQLIVEYGTATPARQKEIDQRLADIQQEAGGEL